MSKNRKRRPSAAGDGSEYSKGYMDGLKASFEEAELDAYYAGVGFGKKAAGDEHIGFTSDSERRQFELGIAKKDEHFHSYRSEPLGFFERLFGKKTSRKDTISAKNVKKLKKKARKTVKRSKWKAASKKSSKKRK